MSFDQAAQSIVAIENAAPDAYGPLVDSFWNDVVRPSGAPFRLLAPFLAQRNFPPAVLERIASRLKEKGVSDAKAQGSPDPATSSILHDARCTPAHIMMHSLCSYLLAAVQGCTAVDDSSHVTNAVLCICRAPTALACAIDSGIFFSRQIKLSSTGTAVDADDGASASSSSNMKITALDLMQQSVMGAIIAMPILYRNNENHHAKLQKLAQAFPYDREHRDIDQRQQRSSDNEFAHGLRTHSQRIKELLEACLRSGAETRNATFSFINVVIDCAKDYEKLQHDDSKLMDRFSLFALAHALILLALPILNQKDWFPRELHAGYLFDPSTEFALVRFGDVETVISGSEAPPRPTQSSPTAAPYHPKFHIFFMALRCLCVGVRPAIESIDHTARWVSHPQPDMNPGQLMAMAALVGRDTALFGAWDEGAANMLRFLDGTAQWLLQVSRVDMATGEVEDDDKPADAMWAHMPLRVVDSVFDIMSKLIVELEFHEHPPLKHCGFYEITNVTSLALMLMGNTHLLPKAYTHLNYPDFLLYLMQHHDQSLRNHNWFVTHSLRGCIDCYIVVEACEYDRTRSRHLLGMMMDTLLKDPSVVRAVHSRYNNADDSRKLERMTKLMASETSVALDMIISSLKDMHEAEEKLGGVVPPPSDGDYAEKKSKVKSGNALASTALKVFTKLLERFKEGMAQHLVVAQVGSMLTTFLIKMAGPGAGDLKSLSMAECGFRPRELLEQLVEAFVSFYDVPDFCKFAVESIQNIDDFFQAVERVKRIGLSRQHLTMGLIAMDKKMREASEKALLDDEVYDDPPDWAICEIMNGLLEDPVILPETENVVERENIRHYLMDNQANPFNRQALTLEDLEKYNSQPEVQQKREEILSKLDAWKKERRQSYAQKKKEKREAQAADADAAASQQK